MSVLDIIELVLICSLGAVILLHFLRLPSILGYLLIGVLVGPYGFGIINDPHVTVEIAEIGVVFLLFTIGLEFSLSRLVELKRYVFIYGIAQVCLTISITAVAGMWLSLSKEQAVVVGAVVAMSSTAIVTKLLKEQNELGMPHGLLAIGILLFQDLAVIPLLILIPRFALADTGGVFTDIVSALIKGGGAIIMILVMGRWILKPLFSHIARMHSLEIFTLTTLVVTLSAAWVTNYFGLSYPLGAFVAGMMLGETEFRHQIAIDIRPFRDIFLGLFFISIGLQINGYSLILYWQWILLVLAALILMKFGLIFVLCWRASRERLKNSMATALVLAHGGEFSFAILNLAIVYNILPSDYVQVILAAIFLSMLVAPIFIRFNQKIVDRLFKIDVKEKPLPVIGTNTEVEAHVIICGFGRVGETIAAILEKQHIDFIGLDLNVDIVKTAQKSKIPIYFGDAQQKEILYACNLAKAKAIVLSFYDRELTPIIIKNIRLINPNITILARCFSDSEVDELVDLGVDEVIPEFIESSLMLAFQLLVRLETPSNVAWHVIENVRKKRYDL
jgi:K+:H+ antiporter